MIITKALQKVKRPYLTAVEEINSSGDAWPTDWHPDGKFIAAAGNMTNKQIIIYSWNEATETLAEVETVDVGGSCYTLDWNLDGDHLAVTKPSDATRSLVIYSWNGTDTLTEVSYAGTTNGGSDVKWHPDGNYIAMGTYNTAAGIIVYSWDRFNETLASVETINNGSAHYGISWSKDGDDLAVTSARSTKEVAVFAWNGSDTLTETDTYDTGGTSYEPRWSSDGSYLFCCSSAADKSLWAFGFDGTTITLKDSEDPGGNMRGIDLFNDRYIICGRDRASAASQEVASLYEFNSTTEVFSYVDGYTANARGVNVASFDARGRYIAAPMFTDSSSYTLVMLKTYVGIVNTEPITWTSRTSGSGANDIEAIDYDGIVFIHGGEEEVARYAHDATGSWSFEDAKCPGTIKAICHGGVKWMVGSYDHNIGVAVTDPTDDFNAGTDPWSVGPIYCLASDGTTFIVGGHNGQLYSTTDDGTNWTSRTSTFAADKDVCAALYVNGLWTIAGEGGNLATSTDGTTWTSRSIGSAAHIYALAYGDGMWVATGYYGVIHTSTDGITWTYRGAIDCFNSLPAYGVAYGNGAWTVVGYHGVIATCSDPRGGWSLRTSNFGTSHINDVTYGNGTWVIVGDDGKIATAVPGV